MVVHTGTCNAIVSPISGTVVVIQQAILGNEMVVSLINDGSDMVFLVMKWSSV